MKLLFLLLFVVSASPLRAQSMASIEQNIGQPLNLQKFGGNDVDIIIRNIDAGGVSVEVKDKSKMVAVAKTTINEVQAYSDYAQVNYNNKVVYVPTISRKQVPKTNGIPVPGSLQKLYLLYEDAKNQVFHQDSIATAANACLLRVLEKPKQP